MSKAWKMNDAEKRVYNNAQRLYKGAQEERDRANKMYNDRLKVEAEEATQAATLKREVEASAVRAAKVQAFSTKINNICVSLGEACKKEGLQIDGGVLKAGWTASEKLIFTVHSAYSIPRMQADVYAVTNKGFRWEIKS